MALVKTSNKPTNYVLPISIKTEKGYVKKLRYYDNEYMLFKAYRQLKAIKGNLIPLYPVIYE